MKREEARALREWIEESRRRERAEREAMAQISRELKDYVRREREAARAMKEELERCRQRR